MFVDKAMIDRRSAMRLLWSRRRWAIIFYKHSAPPDLGLAFRKLEIAFAAFTPSTKLSFPETDLLRSRSSTSYLHRQECGLPETPRVRMFSVTHPNDRDIRSHERRRVGRVEDEDTPRMTRASLRPREPGARYRESRLHHLATDECQPVRRRDGLLREEGRRDI